MKPVPGTYPKYFENYVPLVKEEDVNTAFANNYQELSSFLKGIPPDLENYAYAPGKWTIKQVLNHMTDTERIFTYRALRFARKDPQQPLPFEEDDYAKHAEVGSRTLADLIEEFEAVRKASILLFKSFSDNTLLCSGKTAAGDCTVLALGYTTCGHAIHHMNVLKERYLKK
jgi:hypothetical protein